MSINLRILLFIFSLFCFIITGVLLKKEKIPVKYSLVWILTATVILLVSVFPEFLYMVTKLLGFQTTSNMIIGIILCLLLTITVILTIIVSRQNKRITLLIQEVSLLKKGNK